MVPWLGPELPYFPASGDEALPIAGTAIGSQVQAMTSVKYYRSFDAESLPLQPRGELAEEETHSLVTFYIAEFDESNRLVSLTKLLRQDDARMPTVFATVFTERYEYWPSGRLRSRTLSRSDDQRQRWEFDDRQTLGEKASHWLRMWRSLPVNRKAARAADERLVLCHELLSEIESEILEDVFHRPPDSTWAAATILRHSNEFKEIFETILPGSNPRLSMLAVSEQSHWKLLRGFDEFLNLGVLGSIWDRLESHTSFEPVDLTTDAPLGSDEIQWLRTNDVASLFALPIRASLSLVEEQASRKQFSESLDPIAAFLLLWLKTSPAPIAAVEINSVFRRVGIIVQTVFAMTHAGGVNGSLYRSP